ncbi:MucB/RseB C-terminal domain-containing protein [Vreelandella sp. EE22]
MWARKLIVNSGIATLSMLPLMTLAEDSASTVNVDQLCTSSQLTDSPESIDEWLVRSMLASHCYEYQARAVSIDSLGVRTLALSHRVQEGVRQQVVQHLDGPSISVERRSQAGRISWVLPAQTGANTQFTPQAWADHVEAYYDVTLENEERVAGRVASRLRFTPRDEERYTHTWWVDEDTGLLLKHELKDTQGRVIETFQMTQLQSPERYDGPFVDESELATQETVWQVGWLPEGFVSQPAEITTANPLAQRFYSDGLATISVFATPVDEQTLEAGVYTLGVSTVAIELVEFDDQRWQLVGVGELPSAQVRRIIQSIDFDSAPAS